MNLADLVQSQKIKLLLIGASGAGKTIFSCSGPGKTFVFDFDRKISSAASYFSHHNREKLNQIEYEALFPTPGSESAYSDFRKKLAELEEAAKNPSTFPFATVVLDSLTMYSDALTYAHIAKNPGVSRDKLSGVVQPAMKDYGAISTLFKQDMYRLLALPCHVICIGHSTTVTTESGEQKNGILLTGKIADHLPRIFTEVYWAFVKQTQGKALGDEPKIEHVALTRSNGKYTCRTQIPTIPAFVSLDFKTIQGYLTQTKERS